MRLITLLTGIAIFSIVSVGCNENNIKSSNNTGNSLRKEEIIEKASKALQADNYKYVNEITLDKLTQFVKKGDGNYSAATMPANDSLQMLSMISAGYSAKEAKLYSELSTEEKSKIDSIFGNSIKRNEAVCILNKNDNIGYFIFVLNGDNWFLTAYYIPGGMVFGF